MTKFILHGGDAQIPNAENDRFFSEILRDTSVNTRVLLVHFAAIPEKIDIYRKRDISQFERVKGYKKIYFDEAREKTFIEQVKISDVVYFCGGTTVRLMEKMNQFENLDKIFVNKTIVGESAGANMLSTYCYSKSGGGVIPGLGLVPLKLIPHFDQSLALAKKELEDSYLNFKTLVLPQFNFIVYTSQDHQG